MDNNEMDSISNNRNFVQNNCSFKKLRHVEECKGCLALTRAYLCDLGVITELIWSKGMRVGIRPLGGCTKPEDIDDYLLEHLKKI